MAKPLGYDCDGDLIDAMVETYGNQLQGLSKQQKLFLVMYIAGNLCAAIETEEDELTKPEMTGLAARINLRLTEEQRESLLVALAHLVREQIQASEVEGDPEISKTALFDALD